MTTRKPRDSEIDGIDYMFVSEEDFLDAVENGELLEYARYGVNYYGTPKGPVDKWLEDGHIVILKIDVQGAGNIKRCIPTPSAYSLCRRAWRFLKLGFATAEVRRRTMFSAA